MENLPSVGIKNTREYEADVRGLGIYPAHKTVWQWVRNLFPNLRDAAVRWSEDDAGSMAASVAYYLALSFFPMILLLISGLGLFLKFTRIGQDARQQLLDLIGTDVAPTHSTIRKSKYRQRAKRLDCGDSSGNRSLRAIGPWV